MLASPVRGKHSVRRQCYRDSEPIATFWESAPFNRVVAPKVSPPLGGPLVGPLPAPGEAKKFVLPLPAGLSRTVGEIAELFLRKDGDDGWFVGSALLFANGHALPV